MFNLGFGELAVILVILLIVVGPARLPTLMKSTGKALRTLRDASRDIRTSVGFDEMMREDLLKPAPPRRVPATVSTAPAIDSEPRSATPSATTANAPVAAVAAVRGATDSSAKATAPDPDADTRAPGHGTPS